VREWAELIHFERFGIIGGEPLLNPELGDWLHGLRELMPETPLLLVTNGTRLVYVPGLIRLLVECAPIQMDVTPHLDPVAADRDLNHLIETSGYPFRRDAVTYEDIDGKECPKTVFSLAEPSVSVELFSARFFIKSFKGFAEDMRPWGHDDPGGAIAMCACRYCPLLYDGRLYKCSPIALLKDHLSRVGLLDCPDWQPFLRYKGVSPSDDRAVIEQFVQSFGEPEDISRMCPSNRVRDAWIEHSTTVTTKKQWLAAHGSKWPPG